ncbi:MAG TPA: hypothetical protein VKD72_13590, partial [Gemmataceae bacterium]|nr:hypothetical protein [Gemmataceae bacterium]
EGDVLLVQGAMMPLEEAVNPPEPPPPPAPLAPPGEPPADPDAPDEPMPEDVRAAFGPLLADVYTRTLRGEASCARKAETTGQLKQWAEGNYNAERESAVAALLTPIVAALAVALGKTGPRPLNVAAQLARDHVRASLADPRPASLANGRADKQARAHLDLLWKLLKEKP